MQLKIVASFNYPCYLCRSTIYRSYIAMKPLVFTFAMLLVVSCGGVAQKQNNAKELSDTLQAKELSSSELHHSIEEIDEELATMLKAERNLQWQDYENNVSNYKAKDSLQRAFERRMKYHLCNPITYTEPMPQLEKVVDVITTPSGKAKFYNYWLDGGGTMSCDRNFIQFLDTEGDVHCIPYLNDLRYPRGIRDVWEIELDGTLYYAIKTYHRGANCAWDYYLEVITIDNGAVQSCEQFFDETNGHIWDSEECYIYDDNGDFVDQIDRECWYITVCGTQNCNTNVDFDFDPKTLTVKVKDDADWTESRTGAVVEREWRLSIAK